MPRPQGLPKTGGRRKGTPNRSSHDLEGLLVEEGLDVPRRLVELIPSLLPLDQARVLLDLMGYLYPKRKAIDARIVDDPRKQDPALREKFLKALFADPELSEAALKIGELEAQIYSRSS